MQLPVELALIDLFLKSIFKLLFFSYNQELNDFLFKSFFRVSVITELVKCAYADVIFDDYDHVEE